MHLKFYLLIVFICFIHGLLLSQLCNSPSAVLLSVYIQSFFSQRSLAGFLLLSLLVLLFISAEGHMEVCCF